ncbi:EAL domain-containing protein [Allohahella sp. A8]|uniref:EAL domain-containing protein n=1 Tax=Allohahella sp. A8 TaxID=3141461 RepID=UPI003A808062
MKIVFWLLLLLSPRLLASNAPMPDPVDASVEILPTLFYLEDPDGKRSIEALSEAPVNWQQAAAGAANFGYSRGVFWFRVGLVNVTPQPLNKLLAIQAPFLDHIEFYLYRNDELIQSGVMGDTYPFTQRLIRHPKFLLPMTLDPGETYTYLFRVKESGPMEFPISLWNERAFHLDDVISTQLNSIYYGILLFVILFNSMIFYALREKTYLYYVLFVTTLLLLQSTLHGRTFEYFWPHLPEMQHWLIQLNIPAATLFGSLFAQSFLRVSRHSPVLNLCFRFTIMASLSCLALIPFVSRETSLMISAYLTIPCSMLLLVTGPVLWWRGVREARFFTFAWVGLSMGILSTMLHKTGVLPESFFTSYGIQIGSALEAMLLSIAIVDRIYRERNERLAAHRRSIKDAEERLSAEHQLVLQATHNVVTGLPNRILFENRIRKLISVDRMQPFMVCLIHLSRFHEIDKTLGHDNADRLLCQIANRLSAFCSELPDAILLESRQDSRLRLASTEGVTMGLLLKSHKPVLKEDIDARLGQLEAETRQSVQFDHLTLDPGAKIGVVRYPDDATELEDLMRKAHIALDTAGQQQENLAFYDESFDVYNERRLTLMAELDKAISLDGLDLHFQPQLNLKQNRIVGVETLLRWNHPEYGFIPPDEFVTLAERTGLITPLTRWVMRNTLKALQQVASAGFPLQFSINISAINLKEPDFTLEVTSLLQEFDVRPNDIMLELTETAMMDNPARAREALCRLKKVGVQLSIDDFGTGYSSLSYIKKLPIDEIKIDKSLIFDLTSSSDDQVIVKTTLEMAQNLGYRVVAEGVENQEMLDILHRLDCDLIQGYFLARPMPLAALLTWLAERGAQPLPPDKEQVVAAPTPPTHGPPDSGSGR